MLSILLIVCVIDGDVWMILGDVCGVGCVCCLDGRIGGVCGCGCCLCGSCGG